MASKSKAHANGTTEESSAEASSTIPAAASAVEQLQKFEDKVFGKRAPRVDGKVERGHGSLLRQLSPEDQALHAALEAQADAETALAGAQGQAAAAQVALEAAAEKCTKAAAASEAAASAAVDAQAEG